MSNTTGMRVKAAREAAGLNQREFAKKAEISQSYLAQIEAGTRVGTAAVLRRLAAATDSSVSWLLDKVGEESKGYDGDLRLAVLNDQLAAPGLRALAEDEPICQTLEISGDEWETLRSVYTRVPLEKNDYLLVLYAVRTAIGAKGGVTKT